MIDFGLKPCPLCGDAAELLRLTQRTDHQSAVIKCAGCGLTLEWETEINVCISRSGKRHPQKVGLDPIEAWNRRTGCENCDTRLHMADLLGLPDCNDCGVADCPHRPRQGEVVRINCPLWRAKEE